MSDREIKSYSLFGSKLFVDENYDEATRQRIFAALSPEAKEVLGRPKKPAVVAPEYAAQIWSGIADVHKEEPQKAFDQLVACGRYSGNYATNTYLKLLFKILSVKMFAEKLPQIWSRDASFGKIETDLSNVKSGHLVMRFKELADYPYFGPNCQGWFGFTFETMGLKNVKIELQNWSLGNPDPGMLEYNVSWTP
jgi:hypothetical protein